MPIVSIVFGLALVAISVWSDQVTIPDPDKGKSFTLWIPAMFGGALLLCGLLALREKFLKHAMHAAAALGLICGIAAGSRFVPKLFGEINWNDPPTLATGLTTLVCLLFVGLCVNSFIQARRRRKASEAAALAQ